MFKLSKGLTDSIRIVSTLALMLLAIFTIARTEEFSVLSVVAMFLLIAIISILTLFIIHSLPKGFVKVIATIFIFILIILYACAYSLDFAGSLLCSKLDGKYLKKDSSESNGTLKHVCVVSSGGYNSVIQNETFLSSWTDFQIHK